MNIYSNKCFVTITASDVIVKLQLNGEDIATLNLPFGTAKQLAANIGEIIAEIEEKTGNRISSSVDVATAFGKIDEFKQYHGGKDDVMVKE